VRVGIEASEVSERVSASIASHGIEKAHGQLNPEFEFFSFDTSSFDNLRFNGFVGVARKGIVAPRPRSTIDDPRTRQAESRSILGKFPQNLYEDAERRLSLMSDDECSRATVGVILR
jgi:hypothetical protein